MNVHIGDPCDPSGFVQGSVKGVPGHVRSGRCARVDPPGLCTSGRCDPPPACARRRGSDAASRHLPTREQTYHQHPDNTDVVQDNFETKDKCHSVSIDSKIENGECAEHNIHRTSAKATELKIRVVD